MTSPSRTDTPVTVGVDGSRFAIAAVRVAAAEARMRRRRLRILHVVAWAEADMPINDDLRGPIEDELRARGEILAVAEATARGVAPELDITAEIRVDSSATALIGASGPGDLVVVGEHGHSGLAALILGSTAHRVAAYAHGPVVIARGEPTAHGPVVVGIDGGPGSEPVAETAFAEASMRGVALDAVHAWPAPRIAGPDDITATRYDLEVMARDEARLLSGALAGARQRYPDVPVTELLVRGPVRRTLLDRVEGAQLLVVGTWTHQRLVSTPLGSVSSAMINYATCPVMLVPPAARAEPDRDGPDGSVVSVRVPCGGVGSRL